MDNNLRNRVTSNTALSKDNGIMAVYEAIINAIQAIEEADDDNGKIVVNIIADSQADATGENLATLIKDIEVVDNGIGFNDRNFQSFDKLDSDYKKDKGCHGIGRLMYLKVFEYVTLISVYEENGDFFERKIHFDFDNEAKIEQTVITEKTQTGTVLKLHKLRKDYQSKFPKKITTISQYILEHFYAYFFSTTPPNIVVNFGNSSQLLTELYDKEALHNTQDDYFELKGHRFDVTHVRKRHKTVDPKIHFLADYRQVLEQKTNIRGLTKNLSDENGTFCYACYVSSSYLDKNANGERGGFALPKESDALSLILSLSEITARIEECIASYLSSELNSQITEKVSDVKNHIKEYSPEYSLLLTKLDDNKFYTEIDVNDKPKVDLFLHSLQYDIERETIAKGQKLRSQIKDDDFNEKISRYMQDIEDVQKMDLASYVCHRKVVIDTLSDLLDQQSSTQEADFHNLIFKQHTETPSNSNLWLINDEFMYYSGVSEAALRDLTYKEQPLISKHLTAEQDTYLNDRVEELKGNKRPDILLFPDERKCILLELKDKDIRIEDHLNQINKYAHIIFNCSSHPIDTFYGLLVGENFRENDIRSANPNYKYNETLRAYVELRGEGTVVANLVDSEREDGKIFNKIIKYSDILKQARMRNGIFFEKLGLR